nr:cysteine--tRNA ligase 2, cytoplasmic-like [Ipomoea batatas]
MKGGRVSAAAQECIKKLHNEFESKLSDDLHTPSILNGVLQEALRFMNSSLNTLKKQKKQQLVSGIISITELEKEMKAVLDVLGLLPDLTYSEVLLQLKEKALIRAELTEEDILKSIAERAKAREEKEYAKSDQIRSGLAVKGIALMDVGNETIWRPCVPTQQESNEQAQQKLPSATPPQQEKPAVPPQQTVTTSVPPQKD